MPTVSLTGATRAAGMDFSLYLITDRQQTAGRPLLEVVHAALRGGVGAVQLREKDLADEELYPLARDLRSLTREFGARLLINKRIDICQAIDADGVQLGIGGITIAQARRELGEQRLIAYSAHSVPEARAAESAGADFITFSPVFHTPSKAAYGEPVGLEKLSEACAILSIPVFALGGVKRENLSRVMSAGAMGVAMISAISAAPDPMTEALSLLQAIVRHDSNS